MSTKNETHKYLSDFTRREDALLLRLRNINISSDQLPDRLFNWRQWIGDSQIYLNELRNYIEIEEDKADKNKRKRKDKNIELGSRVRLSLSYSSKSDVKADLIADYQEHSISGKEYGNLLEAIDTPKTVWLVTEKDEYDPDLFGVSLTDGGWVIMVDKSEIKPL